MKSFVLCTIVMIFLNSSLFSQTATEGKVDYQRGEKAAAIIELPYNADIVEGSLKSMLEKGGAKQERLKGMQVFKGTRLSPTDGEVVDLYFKVDKKGKKEDNMSVVYLILGRPNENVGLRTLNDGFRLQDGKAFLNNLMPEVEAYKLETEIVQQEEVIKKNEKSLNVLIDDQKNLEKKISDLQEKLAQNKKEQETQNAEVNKQRSVRDAMLTRRSGSTN